MSFTNQMRFTGMSGLDINDMVSQLMRQHTVRLDRARQGRTLLQWRQESFRSVNTNLTEFRRLNFDMTAADQTKNILSRNNWNNLGSRVLKDGSEFVGLAARPHHGATPGSRDVRVEQAAQSERIIGASVNPQINGGKKLIDLSVFDTRGVSFDVTVNGRRETYIAQDWYINLDWQPSNGGNGIDDFVTHFNTWLENSFGREGATPGTPGSGTPRVQVRLAPLTVPPDGNEDRLEFIVTGAHTVTLHDNTDTGDYADSLVRLGLFDGMSNAFSIDQTVREFFTVDAFDFNINGTRFLLQDGFLRVNGEIVPFEGDLTMRNLLNIINSSSANVRMSFNESNGRFSLESTGMGSGNRVNYSGWFFERINMTLDRNTLETAMPPGTDLRRGQDAVIIIDGQRFERESNSFAIDNITYDLNPITLSGSNVPVDLTVVIEVNSENILEMIKGFVEEYNKLVTSIRELSETARPRIPGTGTRFSGTGDFYMPLTDEQKRAMSEREIELWEEQAKTGILHRDGILRAMNQEFHRFMTMGVPMADGSMLTLMDIGIRTDRNLQNFGQLEIDEERLTRFLNTRINDVADLFTRFEDVPAVGPDADRGARLRGSGIASRLNDLMNWQTSMGGALFEKAGQVGGIGEHSNQLSVQIAQEDTRIEAILRDLARRENRYFEQFSRMEAQMVAAENQMNYMQQMIANLASISQFRSQ